MGGFGFWFGFAFWCFESTRGVLGDIACCRSVSFNLSALLVQTPPTKLRPLAYLGLNLPAQEAFGALGQLKRIKLTSLEDVSFKSLKLRSEGCQRSWKDNKGSFVVPSAILQPSKTWVFSLNLIKP